MTFKDILSDESSNLLLEVQIKYEKNEDVRNPSSLPSTPGVKNLETTDHQSRKA